MIRFFIFLSILFPSTHAIAFGDWTQFGVNFAGVRGFNVHSVFSRGNGSQAVFVRMFQTQNEVTSITQKTPRGWVHIQPNSFNSGTYFYFSNMNENEMKQFLSSMPRLPSFGAPNAKRKSIPFELFSNAHASLSGSYSGFFDVASSCVMGVANGVYEGTAGLLIGVGEGVYELITDPIGTAIALEAKWTQMKTFFGDFQNNMAGLWDGITGLPAEAKADMLCGLVGSIGTDAAIAIFTAGAGSPKLLLTIKTYVSKIAVLQKMLNVFTRFGTGLRRVFTADFYKRLASGKISQIRLNSIETFGRYDQLGLAMEAAGCAL